MLTNYIPFYRRNIRLAFPIVLSQVGQITVHLVDNMMVGHVGTPELAASSFANNVFMIGMYFGMGITYGFTPVVGNAFGKGKMNEIFEWLKNGLFTHLAAGVLLMSVMLGLYFLLPFMGQTEEVIQLARPYYLLLCASYVPFMLFFSLKQFFEGIGNTKIAMQVTLASNVINVILNYILIFGKLGFPELGLYGAGIGTLVSRVFMPLSFFAFILYSSKFRNYFLAAYRQPFDVKKIVSLLKIGIPIAFQIVVEVITFGIGAVMMGWLGEVPLAAHQVALGLASFTYMISLGVSQANTIRVSHQMGVKDYESLRRAAFASTHLVLFFMSLTGVIFIAARFYLPILFTNDAEVIEIAAGLLIVASLFQIFDGLQVIMLSTLRGMADVRIPMYMSFFAYLILGIPASYILTFVLNVGPQGIWFGYLIGLGAAGILFYIRFIRIFGNIRN